MKPIVHENHAAKALSTAVMVLGFSIQFLQTAEPHLQAIFPNIKWISPLTMLVGGGWNLIQRIMDATKQAKL